MSASLRSSELLDRTRSRLLIIDMQERLVPVMHESEATVQRCGRLLAAARLFEIPVDATEQYPQGLGPTVAPLGDAPGECPAKMRFSAANALDWSQQCSAGDRDQIVLCGIEAHVCVLQTALDLLARGFLVSVPADATSSRNPTNQQVALARLAACGVTITCTESVLFEWCETAADPQFKQLSRLVK